MEKTERKGNVIVLIVIAIATMVVVVIGATFAYLASTAQTSNTSNISASTEGTNDLLLIDAGGNLEVKATFENFAEGMGDQTDATTASVLLQANGETAKTYKYRVFLEAPTNDFEYTSGVCYEKSTEVAGVTDKDTCTNGTSNIWAKGGEGEEYKCYATATEITNEHYSNNEVTCLSQPNYMWEQKEVTELALDMYKASDASELACVDAETVTDSTKGICVDTNRHSVAADNKGACTDAGNTWISNVYEGGVCYVPDKSYDITTFATDATAEEKLTIYDEMQITSSGGAQVQDRYRAAISIINLNHNQIVNGAKSFVGNLTFEIIP